MKVAQSYPLCDPMDYTVHGILQAIIVEWVAFPLSKDAWCKLYFKLNNCSLQSSKGITEQNFKIRLDSSINPCTTEKGIWIVKPRRLFPVSLPSKSLQGAGLRERWVFPSSPSARACQFFLQAAWMLLRCRIAQTCLSQRNPDGDLSSPVEESS